MLFMILTCSYQQFINCVDMFAVYDITKAEVLAYLHVQISPVSCGVVGSILAYMLGKTH